MYFVIFGEKREDIMKRMISILLLMAVCFATAAKPTAKVGTADPLQKFWDKTFIPALEKMQVDKIVTMAVFPFNVLEAEEKKHIIDEPFFKSIIKVLFNKDYIKKLKAYKIKDIPFDGTYFRIKFRPEETTANFNEIFSITGCYNYLFKPSDDGKSLIFCGMEINLPCG
jgi:hypothetical protein